MKVAIKSILKKFLNMGLFYPNLGPEAFILCCQNSFWDFFWNFARQWDTMSKQFLLNVLKKKKRKKKTTLTHLKNEVFLSRCEPKQNDFVLNMIKMFLNFLEKIGSCLFCIWRGHGKHCLYHLQKFIYTAQLSVIVKAKFHKIPENSMESNVFQERSTDHISFVSFFFFF